MSLPFAGRCTGCGAKDAALLVFNDFGRFCVDCEVSGRAYEEKPMPKSTKSAKQRVQEKLAAKRAAQEADRTPEMAEAERLAFGASGDTYIKDEASTDSHEKYGIPNVTDAEVDEALHKLVTELESPQMAAAILAPVSAGLEAVETPQDQAEAAQEATQTVASPRTPDHYVLGEERLLAGQAVVTTALLRKDGTYFGAVQKPELAGKRRVVTGCAHHHKDSADALSCAAELAR